MEILFQENSILRRQRSWGVGEEAKRYFKVFFVYWEDIFLFSVVGKIFSLLAVLVLAFPNLVLNPLSCRLLAATAYYIFRSHKFEPIFVAGNVWGVGETANSSLVQS